MAKSKVKITPQVRQNGNGKKPRFENDLKYFGLFQKWLNLCRLDEPPYQRDSRIRDKWLLSFAREETLLIGVLNSVILIDANRGWSLTGGRNTVNRWSDKLHNSDNGNGWRSLMKKLAWSFWNTDLNAIVGLRRDYPFASLSGSGQNREIVKSPLASLEFIDSTQCCLKDQMATPEELSIDVDSTLAYKDIPLFPWDFFRVSSMPAVEEELGGLGYCAVSRALEFAKLMYAIFEHDQEKLGAKMPKGLLMLSNIDENQWNTAMEARKDNLTALEREYYGGLQILTQVGEFPIDAKLIALSSLPDGFDQDIMVNLLMYGYALCFGYDPREFWPVSQGSLGTGKETESQAEKATVKGQGDFSLGFQEKLQGELPETVHFEFQERDTAGEILEAELRKTNADTLRILSEMREDTNPVYTNEQILQLAVEAGLAKEEWTTPEEDVVETDEGELRQRLLDNPNIRRACELYPDEPIVRYSVNWQDDVVIEREITLWDSGEAALKPKVWFTGDGWQLTEEDV